VACLVQRRAAAVQRRYCFFAPCMLVLHLIACTLGLVWRFPGPIPCLRSSKPANLCW
jgi:hypothetical protein